MPVETIDRTIYIFIDESGNFDFSPSGTKYWILTAVTTRTPIIERNKLQALRYELLEQGVDEECFHATEDRQTVRDAVYSNLRAMTDFEVDAEVVQKNKTNPALYLDYQSKGKGYKVKHSGEPLYQKVADVLLQYIFRRYHDQDDINKIVVVLGALFTRNKREFIKKHLKKSLKDKFHKPSYIYFHKSESDINCQIADYCGWAIYRKWEDSEMRPWQEIEDKVRSDYNIFGGGTQEYYEYPDKK